MCKCVICNLWFRLSGLSRVQNNFILKKLKKHQSRTFSQKELRKHQAVERDSDPINPPDNGALSASLTLHVKIHFG